MANNQDILLLCSVVNQPVPGSSGVASESLLRRSSRAVCKPTIVDSENVCSQPRGQRLVVEDTCIESASRRVPVKEENGRPFLQCFGDVNSNIGWNSGETTVVGIRKNEPCSNCLVIRRSDLEVESFVGWGLLSDTTQARLHCDVRASPYFSGVLKLANRGSLIEFKYMTLNNVRRVRCLEDAYATGSERKEWPRGGQEEDTGHQRRRGRNEHG